MQIVWPALTAENRPWTRWWWLGSAVTESEVTRHLEAFHAAGMGGVEVALIYGAKGFEEREIAFLSERWIAVFAHTVREARGLGMDVDLTCGTGWPFGGPWVKNEDTPQVFVWDTQSVQGGERVTLPLLSEKPGAKRIAVSAVSETGQTENLTNWVDASGYLDWIAPAAHTWTVYALFLASTNQQVKRAAPGGAGNVLDHLSLGATRRYLAAFDGPLAALSSNARPRCFFNDSYEVFGANATPEILAEFQKRRGYDLGDHLHHLHGDGDPETVTRVRADYRETVGEVYHENFLRTWNEWARGHQSKTRLQAHGSPGNLLDLYGAADIPETEIFGPARLALGGMKALSSVPPDFDAHHESLICRMASSAAHVAGKPLCSSESLTWLGEHGKVPLAHAKAEIDTLFTLGINHVFFHGTPFSPVDVEWPGWLFYASTHVAPTNPWWRDLPALNTYIARCQSFLQDGLPDNDVLLYFPFHDILASEAGKKRDLLQFLTFHRTAEWLGESLPTFTKTAHELTQNGWTYDMVSDQQLQADIEIKNGVLTAKSGARYRALVIAGCDVMPPETLERIMALAQSGVTVLVLGELPRDVPGLSRLAERKTRFARARAEAQKTVTVRADLRNLLTQAGIARETIADAGIEFVRRKHADGTRTYFFANPTTKDFAGWTPIGDSEANYVLLDPMTGAIGKAETRTNATGKSEVYLCLPSGASLLLRVLPSTDGTPAAPAYLLPAKVETPIKLSGEWHVEFVEGGPALPAARTPTHLSDWTQWQGDTDALRAFSGTARYTLIFDAPPKSADDWLLDLGECHSARVRLNGTEQGTVLARPFRVPLAVPLRPTGNVLEIEVTNLMANRLAHLERKRGEAWRPFLLVNIFYKPFDAATWEPLPSGLLGPIALIPLQRGTQND